MDVWAFIWIMVVLKVPLLGLLALVWYAVRSEPPIDDEPTEGDGGGGGGSKVPKHPPRSPNRRGRPRGPHGEPALRPAPPRVRTVLKGVRQPQGDR